MLPETLDGRGEGITSFLGLLHFQFALTVTQRHKRAVDNSEGLTSSITSMTAVGCTVGKWCKHELERDFLAAQAIDHANIMAVE